MKSKTHTGFRSAQRALEAQPIPAAPPATKAPAAKPRGPLFGGKQAPLFTKKSK